MESPKDHLARPRGETQTNAALYSTTSLVVAHSTLIATQPILAGDNCIRDTLTLSRSTRRTSESFTRQV